MILLSILSIFILTLTVFTLIASEGFLLLISIFVNVLLFIGIMFIDANLSSFKTHYCQTMYKGSVIEYQHAMNTPFESSLFLNNEIKKGNLKQ